MGMLAEWLAHGSGELGDPNSNPPVTVADFSDIAEWPKNTHMLPTTLLRADNLHKRVQGSSISLESKASLKKSCLRH